MRRALDLLLALGTDEAALAGGLGVVRLAELVEGEKSRVSRTLKTLDEYGLVERAPTTQAYRLGPRLFALAARYGSTRLLEGASSHLRRLVAAHDERAHLSVLDGPFVTTLLSEAPTRAVQAAGWVGRAVPSYCTSAGRALLFDHDEEALALRFEPTLPEAGLNAPRTRQELAERIAAARLQGYAIADEEMEQGLTAVAAPVRDFTGSIVASINVSGPTFRFREHVAACGESTRREADSLSAYLGYPRAPAS